MYRESAVVGLDYGVRYLRKEARINADVERMVSVALAYRANMNTQTREYKYCMLATLSIVLLKTKGRFLAGALSRIHCTLSCAHQKDFHVCAAARHAPRMIPDTHGNSKRNS